MADKVRRQKDIVKNNIVSYKSAVNEYQDYFAGESPVEIVYYQIADEASRTDTNLEDTHEVVGTNSSIKYYSIKNVLVHGISLLDISTQLTQRGIESFITGEFVITPELSINPRSGEFFSIVDETFPELSEHLFQITDVQYDRATSQKFYKCSYKLYPYNKDTILGQVIKKFVYDPSKLGNTDGVGDSVLITEETAVAKNKLQALCDSLIDKYEGLFYNEGMDTFTYQKALNKNGTEFEYYWCPYICHFIYKNNILEKTKRDFLTEIFVQDINESTHPGIYSEKGYRNSIWHAVEMHDSKLLNIDSTFLEVSAYDLSKPLNLPFFSSGEKYNLLDVKYEFNTDFWLGAFNWVLDNEDIKYFNIPGTYKYSGELGPYLLQIGAIDAEGNTIIDSGIDLKEKVFYNLASDAQSFDINRMIYIPSNNKTDVEEYINYPTGDQVVPVDCDIKSLLASQYDIVNNYLFKILRVYFTGETFTIDDTVIDYLENYYYENNMMTFILLPIVIYILQNS